MRPHSRAVLLYLGVFLLYVNIYAVPPLTLSIIQELGIGHLRAGLLMTTFAVVYCVGNALVGYLSDRVGTVRVMAGGLVLGFLASVLLSIAGGFALMVASRVLSGMAAAAMTTPCLVTLMGWFPPQRKSLSVSLHLAALTLGSAVVFLITPLLLQWQPWRVLLRLYAAAGLLVLLPFPLLFRGTMAAPPAKRRGRTSARPGTTPAVVLLCAVLFLCLFEIGGALTWLPPWLQERAGFSPLQVGLAAMTFSLVGIPSTLLGGYLADRNGGQRGARIITMSLIGVLVSSSIVALGWLRDARLFPLVLLVIVLARWGSFMSVGPLLSLVPRLAPEGGQGALMGLVNAVTMTGSVAASFVGGMIVERTGGYRLLWVVFSAALLLSAAVLHPLLRRNWLLISGGSNAGLSGDGAVGPGGGPGRRQ